MDFKKAVELYKANPCDDVLFDVCAKLRAEMTLNEKIGMLSGSRTFLLVSAYGLLTKGQKYNYLPYNTRPVERLGVPAVAFSDGPRGVVMGNSTCFPVSMARAASFNDELEYKIGQAIAEEIIAGGGNYFGGVCINLLRNPRWGRAQESYGEDQYLQARMGIALTKAVQEKGVIACIKHFACNSIENLRFSVDVSADEKTMQEIYLYHFRKCIEAGAMSVMGAYNKVRGKHCCESKYLLTDVLRKQWNFKGFTISDFLLGVYDGPKSLKSGLDIEMPSTNKYACLKNALKKGVMEEKHIDDAVEHILAGLITVTPAMKKYPKTIIACNEHTYLAHESARESVVLLKNDGILPFRKETKVAVIGRYANKKNVGDHGSSSVASPYTVTPYEGLKNALGEENVICFTGRNIEKHRAKIAKCDVAVVCVGSDFRQEGENLINLSHKDSAAKLMLGGDRYSLRIPADEVELIHKVCAMAKKTVVNIIGGSAYIIEEWKDEANAILESFYSGMEGGNALADILTGKVNPSGHLPFTMAKVEEDYPYFLFPGDNRDDITYGYYHGYALLDKENKKAAFPFGFGLSYTTFEYSDLKLEQKEKFIDVTVKVKNSGEVDGKTVVQVYAGAREGEHPLKQLKGFKKVFLRSGETADVTVQIEKEDLRFYSEENEDWYYENAYNIFVGEDSEKAHELTCVLKL